jgi:DNA adenine methylase
VTQPFLRWTGGKRLLADRIRAHIPDSYGRYIEPFAGSGAVFFATAPRRATLGDLSPELTNAYEAIRDDVDGVIEWLKCQRQTEAAYYRIRALTGLPRVERAARFIYLNRTAFNGIWRVNRHGQFNVPYGFRPRPDLVDGPGLRAASRALKGIRVITGDFELTLRHAKSGDVVYADPPYTMAHSSNGFRKYNEILFSWADQQRLARVLNRLAAQQVRIVVSNSDHVDVMKLYPEFRPIMIDRYSSIAGKSSARGVFREALYVSG